MRQLTRVLTRPLTSVRLDIAFAQAVFMFGGLGVLILSILKMATLQLTEAQLFLGILTTLTCSILLMLVGMIMPLVASVNGKKETK